jgi:hypothetical protein
MRNLLLLILFAAGGMALRAQSPLDTLRRYDLLLESEPAEEGGEFSEEEDYSGYFLPARTGNGNYLPMGQLSRGLIGVRFRPRGYENRYLGYEVNGAELFDPTDGFPYWNLLSAIQVGPNARADVQGLAAEVSGVGSLDGITSLSTADRYIPRGNRLSYARTNRTYSDRVTGSSGVEVAGWTIRTGLNVRTGKDGFVEGLETRRYSLSVSLGRDFNGHTLNLLAVGYQGTQGVRSAVTQEVYDLIGDPYYNPNWGLQNGRVRNSRSREYTQALALLSYSGRLDERWTLRSSVSIVLDRNAYTLPAWYDAPTPYPDYYRYLPDFYVNPKVADALREAWKRRDPAIARIDWTSLHEVNRYHTDANGIPRSHYILKDLVTAKRNLEFASSILFRPDSRLDIRGGIRLRSDHSDNYSRMNDLLGGSYWLDIDQYLLDDEYYGDLYQNDMRNPDRAVFEGQRFGYSYRMRSTTLKAWGAVDYRTLRWSAFVAAEAGKIAFQREGLYEKEMFPGDLSYGPSEKVGFPQYRLKVGVFYHFSLRHRIGMQAVTGTQAPLIRNVFVAPSYRNETLPGRKPVGITGAEALYQWISPQFSMSLTGYYTRFSGENEIRNFYDDIDGRYMNLALTGIDKSHIGMEWGVEWNVTPRLSLSGVLSAGFFQYANDPRVTLYRDSDGEILLSDAVALLSGYRLSGTPQQAAMMMLNYRTRDSWRFEVSIRHAAHNYVSMNPLRRMSRALDLAGSPEARREMAAQERLDDAVLLSLSVGKTFRLPNGHRLGFWVHGDNLLDDRTIRYSGYEQWRFSRTSDGAGRTLRPFPSKYYYAYGINYYAMVSYAF